MRIDEPIDEPSEAIFSQNQGTFFLILKGETSSPCGYAPGPPTHRSPTNRPPTQKSPTQPTRFYFKDLINREYLFYRTQTQLGRCKVKLWSI